VSYTTFEYSDLKLSQKQLSMPGTLIVTLNITNTGPVAGQEIVQLYVRDVESTVFRPEKELKGFAKVHLEPGETQEVAIELDERAFAYYNTDLGDWHVEAGAFEILVGASSRDIRLTDTVDIAAAHPPAPAVDREKLAVYYTPPKGTPISQRDFEALLGRPVPPNQRPQKGAYTLNTPIGDMRDSFIGRQLYKVMASQIKKMIAGQEDTPMALLMEAMIREMPLRGMLMSEDSPFTRKMLEALLKMINGKLYRGIGALIRAMNNKKKR
jgi:beta-glucosidase